MSATENEQLRAKLASIADILIPAHEAMPAASSIGIAGFMLDRVLNFRPELRSDLFAALRKAPDPVSEAWVRDAAENDPAAFGIIAKVVAHGYYLNDEVREKIGYPGQERIPFDPDLMQPYEEGGMLQKVLDRGPIWRDPRSV